MPWRVGLAAPLMAATPDDAILLVARDFGTEPELITSPLYRHPRIVLVRKVAVYFCSVGLDREATQVAMIFQQARTTVRNWISQVEDWRENAGFDQRMDRLTDRLFRVIEDRRDDPVFDERLSRMEMRLVKLTYKSTIAAAHGRRGAEALRSAASPA